MRVLERVQREGKRVTSFVSWCGGLPEPSASNVPFGYKFSWSPKAVLTAALNPASYKLDNQVHHVAGDQLLASHFADVPLWKGLALEGLANRDSLPYAEKYGMGEGEGGSGMRDLFRGTLRYVHCSPQHPRRLDVMGAMLIEMLRIGTRGFQASWTRFVKSAFSELDHSTSHSRAGPISCLLCYDTRSNTSAP